MISSRAPDAEGCVTFRPAAHQSFSCFWPSTFPSTIAFFTESGGLTSNREIWTVLPNGTHLTQVTHNHVDDSYPSWSPAGGRITLQRDVPQGDLDFYDVWTMKPNGTDLQRVTHDAFTDGVPNWQPK